MLALAIKSSAVLGLAWLLTLFLRRRSAAVKHLVWTASAAAVLVLPLLSIVMPVLRVPAVDPGFTTPAFYATAIAPREVVTPLALPPAIGGLQQARTIPNWPGLIWSAGTFVLLVRMLIGYASMWRMRRSARVEVSGPVKILESSATNMPMTFGILRPVILLPMEAREWTEERRRVVLSHELAHVRRGDAASHMLVWAAVALYWWNPLVWVAWRRVRKESECAADDLVLNDLLLNHGIQASQYASHLLEIAGTMSAPWMAVAMARSSHLEGRLRAILDSNVNRSSPGRAAMLATAMVTIAVLLPLAALKAQDAPAIPADVDAAIRAALSQKNHEILESAAQAAVELRKYDTAQKLLESAAEIRAEVSGRGSFDYGLGLLKLGDLEVKRHDRESADDFYTRAAAVLGDRPEAARAWTGLGISSILNKNLAQAAEDLEKAQGFDPKSGAVLLWMAVVRDRQGNVNEAEALFRKSLAIQDPKSADGVVIARAYGHFLRKMGQTEEAREIAASVATVPGATKAEKTAGATVYRIGGPVSAPAVLSKVEPEYTDEARAAQLDGTVRLMVEIGPDGVARNFNVTQSLGLGLDENAMDAISQWRFRPGMKDGQFVAVAATIEVNFHLL